jgi:hypothetical protein
MNNKEIEQIFEDLKIATIEFFEASKKEDDAKLEKIAKYKKLQLARSEANNIKFI